MKNKVKTIAIYHKDCSDGTAAAAVVLKKYPGALVYPMSHGYVPEELAPVMAAAAPGDQIFTVDCVLGVKEFLAAGYKVTSIDHHIGKKDECQKLTAENKNFTFIFDNDKSGASLAWSYFFPNKKVPEIIRYVEDSDLWKWKLGENTGYVSGYLFMLVNKPEEVIKLFKGSLKKVLKEGSIIRRYSKFNLDYIVKEIEPINVIIGNHKVPFYNIMAAYRSEAGNIFARERGKAVGIFMIDGPEVKISFRSLDNQNPSALELAKTIGGGGHRNAAGAAMTLSQFVNSIVRE